MKNNFYQAIGGLSAIIARYITFFF